MNIEPAIQIKGVSKQYPVFTHPWQAMRYLMAFIRRGRPNNDVTKSSVQALTNINLQINKGERVGLVGRNGAGKSTLLKLISGDFPPTTGPFSIHGSTYCLFPGSVNFSPEQSTEENARQYLNYLGMPSAEINLAVEEIRDFTELGEYFEQPVKKLSLGMRMRAEFAVATAQSADIIIIDEVLGAGDIYWSEKIARRIEHLSTKGITLLLVSHSLSQIGRYCERAVWIENGKVMMDGPAWEVTKRYESFLEHLSWQTDDIDDKSIFIDNTAIELGKEVLPDSGQTVIRWPGRRKVLFSGVWLNDRPVQNLELNSSDPLKIRLRVQVQSPGKYKLRYRVTFWDSNNKRFAVIENEVDHVSVNSSSNYKHDVVFFRSSLGLKTGQYYLSLTLSDVLPDMDTNEYATRLDILSKSIKLNVNTGAQTIPFQPMYRLNMKSKIIHDAGTKKLSC